jgi:hypothetical protein
MSYADPWQWRPSQADWLLGLQLLIRKWQPDSSLGLDADRLKKSLTDAAMRGEPWLFHPALHVLYRTRNAPQQDAQLAVWCAAHVRQSLGALQTQRQLWIWSPSGGQPVEPGRYQLGELGASIASDDYRLPVALDPWLLSSGGGPLFDTGFAPERFWSFVDEVERDGGAQLERDITCFMRAAQALMALPACLPWLSATRVVVPLVPAPDSSFNSSSQPEFPGLVFSDTKDESQILEALMHETAHHYFRLAEAAGPLVEPTHQDTYASPLRDDPRPLRGIFLAFHALAYIVAFFEYARKRGQSLVAAEELQELALKRDEAHHVLRDARAQLTPAGRNFLHLTSQVAAYEP